MTAFHFGTTGETYYAKALPLTVSPWSTGVIAMTETNTTGWFSFTNDPLVNYAIYRQLGGSPASSDVADGVIGGGRESINVLPAVGIVASRTPSATINPLVGETISQSITLYETDGTTAVSLAGKTLAIVFETMRGVDVSVVASGAITISGANDNVVTFAYPSAVTSQERTLKFAIRDAGAPLTMYLQGLCVVTRAPQVDA